MNHTRILNFALAALVGLAVAVPVSVPADDTEIYTGDNVSEGIKPNVLFILDTSGSMNAFDGQSKDRLDRMKDALNVLLDNVDNVNVGLMRFTDPGGPILFPVAGVDADATAIDQAGQTDITVRVSDGTDDAEELIEIATAGGPALLNDVKLDSAYLELLDTPGFGQERSVISGVASGEDDAEQSTSFSNNFSSLESVFNTAGNGTRTVGFRFQGIENVNKDTDGARVLFSQLRLTSRDERSGALNFKVFGLFARDMDSFPNSRNGAGNCGSSPLDEDIYCRLGLTSAAEYNAGLDFNNVETFSRSGVNAGNITDAVVTWNDVPDTVTDEQIVSPDLSPIIQEIFDHPQWQSGDGDDDLGIFYTGTTASHRVIYPRDESFTHRAELQVDYVPAGSPSGRQLVALRFRGVNIPQGAKIETAKLELFSVGESDAALDIRISGEKVDNAPQFNASQKHLSTRLANSRTASTVVWTLTAADQWTDELPVQTPDITTVIREVVGQNGWCGGNDLVLFMEYHVPPGAPVTRRVHAYDGAPSLAATLKVDYDQTAFGAGQGCTVDEITRQVAADKDDAEERVSNGTVALTSPTIEMTTRFFQQTNGFIFRNIQVPRGATIENAVVEFTATGTFAANAATLTVTGQDDDEVQQFESSSFNVSNRIVGASGTAATATFTIPPSAVTNDTRFATADLSSIISEITSRADWDLNDEIGLVFTGTGRVDLYSHDRDPSKAALLRMRVRYNVGDVLAAGDPPASVTVRQRLKEIVNELTHDGYTPIVDTLYEAALYYRGEPILYGASRGDGGSTVERNTRVSHPGSYEKPPGTVEYPTGCNADDSNLNDEACRKQLVLGSPSYISPIRESCQANFIVLLTDGDANNNHSANLIRTKTGVASCVSTFTDGTNVVSGEQCGLDLVKYLRDVDQAPDVSGDNSVITYTIGFNISNQFLKDMAVEGGGQYYEASSSAELAQVFQAIFTDVLSSATSFAAPSLSVNAFNRLEDRNEVYFSLFEPSTTARWNGNIKKFQLCQSSTDDCATVSGAEIGDVMDARDPPQLAVGDDGRILDTALSFWTTEPDGPAVLSGGTGNQVPPHASRRVFTLSDETLQAATPPAGTVTFYPSSADLGADKNKLVDVNGDGIIDGLSGSTAEKLLQTQELLGMGTATPAELKAQIDWIRGKNVDGTGVPENRYSFSDPLHGNPLALTYGGTADNPILKLLAGTNDGGIRLINSNSGVEEWIFYPPTLLPMQTVLRANPATDKIYGVDGSATPWIRDRGKVGIIEPAFGGPGEGDFIRVFIGQRRGGNHYWGLDISPTTEIPEADLNGLTHVTPRLMWRIRGGTPEYPLLGQSWSKPFLATMLVGTTIANQAVRKTVLIFTGGYEPDSQDGGFAAGNNVGNAIYVADAETGQRLFYVAGPDQAGPADDHGGITPDRGVRVPDMLYPIPSDVAAFDADGDGSADRLYVGDTGGQMWRVDFRPNRAAGASNDGMLAVVGKLATVSSATADADKRKFFYPPSIIQVRGAGSHSNADYDLVSAVTGNRANPLNKSVHDRFYAFRDYAIGPLADADSNGLADGYTTIRGDLVGAPAALPPVPVSTFGDMLDFTLINDPTDPDQLANPNDFVTSNGYFIRLETGGAGSGEKGLAAPTTIAGRLFFTTYLPEGVVSSGTCSLAEGRGQLYGLDAITGAAIFNWDNDAGGNITLGDRVYTLGSGIPSNPVPVFFPEKVMLLVGVGGGAEAVDPNIALPQGRTYWFQQ